MDEHMDYIIVIEEAPSVSTVVFTEGNNERCLTEEYNFEVVDRETCNVSWYTIPKGFTWDGASIPKFAWGVLGSPFGGRYYTAALLHDYFYRTACVTKQFADKVFYYKMRQDGVGWWKANTMYYAVKWFGGGAYSG